MNGPLTQRALAALRAQYAQGKNVGYIRLHPEHRLALSREPNILVIEGVPHVAGIPVEIAGSTRDFERRQAKQLGIGPMNDNQEKPA